MNEKFKNFTLVTVWPLLLKELIQVFENKLPENAKELIPFLDTVTIQNYNLVPIRKKIDIL